MILAIYTDYATVISNQHGGIITIPNYAAFKDGNRKIGVCFLCQRLEFMDRRSIQRFCIGKIFGILPLGEKLV